MLAHSLTAVAALVTAAAVYADQHGHTGARRSVHQKLIKAKSSTSFSYRSSVVNVNRTALEAHLKHHGAEEVLHRREAATTAEGVGIQEILITASFGSKSYSLALDPLISVSALSPSTNYQGGTAVQKKLPTGTSAVYTDTVTFAGFTASNVPIGIPQRDIFMKMGNDDPKGYLSFARDDFAHSFTNTVDSELVGFANQVGAAGKYLRVLHGSEFLQQGLINGVANIDSQEPTFWVANTIPQWGAKQASLNGQQGTDVYFDMSAAFSTAPKDAVSAIFKAWGVKEESTSDMNGHPTIRAEVDCNKGVEFEFTIDQNTFSISGPGSIIKAAGKQGDICYAALQSSSKGFWNFGYALFRAAEVTFDAKGNRIGFTPQKKGASSNVVANGTGTAAGSGGAGQEGAGTASSTEGTKAAGSKDAQGGQAGSTANAASPSIGAAAGTGSTVGATLDEHDAADTTSGGGEVFAVVTRPSKSSRIQLETIGA
ncbi:unnamed protein product [Parajaminaea phylloscopi]